jgi:hypothetical protein
VPNRVHESVFERGHEDAIRDPVGGIGGRFALRNDLKLLHDSPGFEEEFADLLEKEDGALGGFRHEFYLWLSLGAFMAAGSVTERKDSDPEYEPQPLLAAGCKGTFAIDRRQRPTPGVGATNGDILPVRTGDSGARVLDHARLGRLVSAHGSDLSPTRPLGGSGMTCPQCQQENLATMKFCGECGTPLGRPQVDAPPALSYADVQRSLTEALEQQTATSAILRVISSSPTDIQPVFDTIIERAVRLCDARLGALLRFDGQTIHLAALGVLVPGACPQCILSPEQEPVPPLLQLGHRQPMLAGRRLRRGFTLQDAENQ